MESTTNNTIQDALADAARESSAHVVSLLKDRRYSEAHEAVDVIHHLTGLVIGVEDHVLDFEADYDRVNVFNVNKPESIRED